MKAIHMEKKEDKTDKTKKVISISECRQKLREKIYQSNPLIEARKYMNNIELKIFILGLQGVNPHISNKDLHYDKEFKPIFISTKKLVEIFGNTKYIQDLKAACKELFNAIISIEIKKSRGESFTLQHIFSKLNYEDGEGLYILFDNQMKPYILDLYKTKGYTKYSVDQVFKLSSSYGIRLCELLLQFQGAQKRGIITRTITVEDLKFALNVSDDTHKRMDHFKQVVLELPIKEINKKTDYIMWYEVVKPGRKITAFKFYMDINKALETEKEEAQRKEESMPFYQTNPAIKLSELGFSYESSKAMLSKCENGRDLLERLEYAVKCYEKSKNKIKNKQGYIRKAIEENWLAKSKKKKSEEMDIREIWRKAHINGLSVEDEIMREMQENLPINPDGVRVKRLLTKDEVRRIQLAHLESNWKDEIFNILNENNWSWSLFREMYGF